MLYVIIGHDAPEAREKRPQVRPAHLAHLDPLARAGRVRLAGLASDGDPAEGAMMRGLAAHFRQALVRGALGQAREAADVMRERSGSVLTPKKAR